MQVLDDNITQQMEKLAVIMKQNEADDQNSANEKLQLLKNFVEFLESEKLGDCPRKMHKRGNRLGCGFGRHGFEKHGFGRYGHWRHGKFGHGMHRHGMHGHGRHGLGRHGHGQNGHHGHDHHHHHRGRFWAHWAIDLTQNDKETLSNNVNETNEPNTSSTEENNAEGNKTCCKFSRGCRNRHGYQGHRRGSFKQCPYKRNMEKETGMTCQTEGDENPSQNTQENLTTMVEKIIIKNAE